MAGYGYATAVEIGVMTLAAAVLATLLASPRYGKMLFVLPLAVPALIAFSVPLPHGSVRAASTDQLVHALVAGFLTLLLSAVVVWCAMAVSVPIGHCWERRRRHRIEREFGLRRQEPNS